MDYVNTNGTLRFAPGETSKTMNVTVCGDTLDEPSERFRVVLSNPVNATILTNSSSGGGIIGNDDYHIPLSVWDVSASEPDDKRIGILDGILTFTIELSDDNHNGRSIDYACSRVTARPSQSVSSCITATTSAAAARYSPSHVKE